MYGCIVSCIKIKKANPKGEHSDSTLRPVQRMDKAISCLQSFLRSIQDLSHEDLKIVLLSCNRKVQLQQLRSVLLQDTAVKETHPLTPPNITHDCQTYGAHSAINADDQSCSNGLHSKEQCTDDDDTNGGNEDQDEDEDEGAISSTVDSSPELPEMICHLDIYDVADQDPHQYTNAVVLVYDIKSRRSFEEVRLLLDHTKQQQRDVIIILVGSKCDKIDKREVDKHEGLALAHAFGGSFLEVSARTGHGIGDLLHRLVYEGVSLGEVHPESPDPSFWGFIWKLVRCS